MATAQIWKSSKFTIERNQGQTPGTVIFRLTGPFTARDMIASLSPSELRNTFEPEGKVAGCSPYPGSDRGSLHGFCGARDDRQPLCPVSGKRGSACCGGSEFAGGAVARVDQGG